jgi:hypothetical protein
MVNLLVSFAFQILCFLPFFAICWIINRKVDLKIIGMAIAIMLADGMLVALTKKISLLHFEGQNWNWFGKGAEVIFGSVVFYLLPISWRKFVGDLSSKRVVALLSMLTAGGIFVGFMNPAETFNAQTWLFQLLMPSLSEEFVYRGVLFAIFIHAFAGPRAIHLSAILVTIWFGIVHGIGVSNWNIQIDLASLVVTAFVGGLLVAIRVSARSIFFPILGHSIYNILIQAVTVLRL